MALTRGVAPRPSLLKVCVVVFLATASDAAKKKKKRKAAAPPAKVAELSECAACENWASDATAFVRAKVRHRLNPPPAPAPGEPVGLEPTWEMRLNRTCRSPRLPWCESWRVHENAALIAELQDLSDAADDVKDSSIDVLSISKALCAHDGPVRVLSRNDETGWYG